MLNRSEQAKEDDPMPDGVLVWGFLVIKRMKDLNQPSINRNKEPGTSPLTKKQQERSREEYRRQLREKYRKKYPEKYGRKKSKRPSKKKKTGLSYPGRIEFVVTAILVLAAVLMVRNHSVDRYRVSDRRKYEEEAAELYSSSPGTGVLPARDGQGRRPEIEQQFLTPNPYSRSQSPLKKVNGLVIHYVANPGTSAQANRDYFEGLKESHLTKASSHFIIGLSGEIIQCIPLDEISYASNHRNKDTISIECCHPEEDGKFNEETYQSLVKLSAWLCNVYGLEEEDIIRHYDVTGKMCPIYYVKHKDAWKQLKKEILIQR